MKRLADWPERLAAFLTARRRAALEWGVHDCCAFTAGGIAAQTGVDLLAQAPRKYKTARGAAAFLARYDRGLIDIAEQMARDHGVARVPLGMAGRGCPVLGRLDDGEVALGLIGMDGQKVLFAADTGYVARPRGCCFMAWGFD